MAYETLKPDPYYIQNTNTLGIPGSQAYGIRYDSSNGDYQLIQRGVSGYGLVVIPATLYKNGSYTSDAIKDSRLFVDGDPNKPTPLAQSFSVDIRKKVYAAYQAKGGAAGKNVVNNTATPKHQNDPAGVNNSAAGTNPGIATAIPGTGALAAPPGQGNIFDPGFAALANLNFNSSNEKDIFKDSLLLYPIDILKEQQDTLQITMYRYRPPAGDIFTNKNYPISSIFTQGIQRNSALKEPIATTILPIPSGIQDNNAISWGDDSMNNMTAAVAGSVSQNPGPPALTQAITTLASNTILKGLNPGAINQIAAIGQAAGSGTDVDALLKNPQTRAAITSLLLKNAQFEVPAETILARGGGIVPNSNLELLFQGPTIRSFGFTWRMSPRSESEARNVKRIIRMFKQGSAPRKLNSQSGAGAASLFLGTPNVFKLSYKTAGNKEISGLNKFKICALVNMSVVYAPDGQWSAYAEGQPVSVQMSLNFQEIEPVYENDYQENVSKEFKGNYAADNYSSVNPDDVGY
jgi:hypothetical protein